MHTSARNLKYLISRLMSGDEWQLPESQSWSIKETDACRGVVAKVRLKANTHLLTTSPSLSPIAYVILRIYRREVCALCFAYDRGREWKIRNDTGLVFCSSECEKQWLDTITATEVETLRLVETHLRKQRKDEDTEMSNTSGPTWEEAAEEGARIVEARNPQPSKEDKRILQRHMQSVDPDIVHFLLSGCLADCRNSLMALADNDQVYTTASRAEHIKAYHLLQAVVPTSLLHLIQASHCHELVSRASHNAFSIRPSGDQSEFLGYGIWPEASYFNHSCQPNVRKERLGRQWSFWTSSEVEENEELCITYLGEETELGVSERRQRLQDEWGFFCRCQKCLRESRS